MQKILLAIDPDQIDMNAVDFACFLSRLTHSRLTGVFLEDLEHKNRFVVKELAGRPYLDTSLTTDLVQNKEKRKVVADKIRLFQEACQSREVCAQIQECRGLPIKEMIGESRFTDILITDAQTSFSKNHKDSPSNFVTNVLQRAECAVIIVPGRIDNIDQIVFSYDGSASSVFAIKQFTYLFPEFNKKPVVVLEANSTGERRITEKHNMLAWLNVHYESTSFEMIQGDPQEAIFSNMLHREGAFLVMGAYGRPLLSRLFKPSHAEDILKMVIGLPIFIAHQ
jgi:hypothetical protein